MTLKHLRICAEVCRMESITEAAKNLNMAQPAAVSYTHLYFPILLLVLSPSIPMIGSVNASITLDISIKIATT